MNHVYDYQTGERLGIGSELLLEQSEAATHWDGKTGAVRAELNEYGLWVPGDQRSVWVEGE